MKNVFNIGIASSSCSICFGIINRCLGLFFFTLGFYLHILIQKYLSIVVLNFLRLYISHFQLSKFLCCSNHQ